jgi:hypothetical protein
MAYFSDLSPYAYGHDSHPGVVHVGWLDGIHPYPQGIVDARLVEKIKVLASRPGDDQVGVAAQRQFQNLIVLGIAAILHYIHNLAKGEFKAIKPNCLLSLPARGDAVEPLSNNHLFQLANRGGGGEYDAFSQRLADDLSWN